MSRPASVSLKWRPRRIPARQRVMNLLEETSVALSPSELERKLTPLMNRVTIYRALQVLVLEGVVGRLTDGRHRARYYVKSPSETVSVQFSCDHCHELIALPGLTVPLPVLPVRYQFNTGQMLMTGLCPDCQREVA